MIINLSPPIEPSRTADTEAYVQYLYRYICRTVSDVNRVLANIDTENITSLDVSVLTGDIDAFVTSHNGTGNE